MGFIWTAMALILLILPFILTIQNILFVFMKKYKKSKYILINDILIMLLGPSLTTALYCFQNTHKDYDFQFTVIKYENMITEPPLHSILATWTIPSILVIVTLAVVSYLIIRLYSKNLPPLINVIGIAGMYLGSILSILWLVHVTPILIANKKIIELYLIIFPINYIICSAKLIVNLIINYEKKETDYKNKILNICSKLLQNSKTWPIYGLIFMIPLLALILVILVLLGQKPDALIQAFTETSDWALSLKESPPPLIVEPTGNGHYLCTVSLKGHPKIVKPIRYGIRNNNKIIINRQLCVANAFEDLIKERVPIFHKYIRSFYDKYGYPLSKHINTAISADIIYILMKPLEYVFVFTLYLFDRKPEDRIARQYLPNYIIGGNKIENKA